MTKKDPLHETKKKLTVFCPTRDCPLKYTELLVYCHRADQHRYDTLPSCRRVAKGTGLKESTVAEATERLAKHGLLAPDGGVITPCPHPNWFVVNDALKARSPEGSLFSWLQNWKTLVRTPGADNLLTVPAVMVYSLIRHSALHGWKPSGGWTQEYLALLTATNPKTVQASLKTLEEKGFLSILDGMRFRIYSMRESQLACFANKGEFSGNSSEPDEFVEEFSSNSGQGEEIFRAKKSLREFLDVCDIPDLAKQKWFEKIVSDEHPASTWLDQANYYVSEYHKKFR